MRTFLMVQEGVYRHSIHGVFTNEEDAVNVAVAECRNQEDDYHDYIVYSTTLDEPVTDVVEVCRIARNTPSQPGPGGVRWLMAYYANGKVVEFDY